MPIFPVSKDSTFYYISTHPIQALHNPEGQVDGGEESISNRKGDGHKIILTSVRPGPQLISYAQRAAPTYDSAYQEHNVKEKQPCRNTRQKKGKRNYYNLKLTALRKPKGYDHLRTHPLAGYTLAYVYLVGRECCSVLLH